MVRRDARNMPNSKENILSSLMPFSICSERFVVVWG